MLSILLAASIANAFVDANETMTEVEQIEIRQCVSNPQYCDKLSHDAVFMADSIESQSKTNK